MNELIFQVIDKTKITNQIALEFISMLEKQGKVIIPSVTKIKSCRQIILCYVDKKLVGIGALKTKTKTDFNPLNANLLDLEKKFDWELGYFYVETNVRKLGIATTMTRLLISDKLNENLLASTELYSENKMIYILEKFGFRQYGNPWNSKKHNGTIGLFLKFQAG